MAQEPRQPGGEPRATRRDPAAPHAVRWRWSLLAGGVIAAVQVVVLSAAMLVWSRTAGSWGRAHFATYLVAAVIVGPAVGWMLAARAVGGRARPLDAWPVSFVSFVVILLGPGLEYTDLPAWTPLSAIAWLSALFGTPWFFEKG